MKHLKQFFDKKYLEKVEEIDDLFLSFRDRWNFDDGNYLDGSSMLDAMNTGKVETGWRLWQMSGYLILEISYYYKYDVSKIWEDFNSFKLRLDKMGYESQIMKNNYDKFYPRLKFLKLIIKL